MTQTILTQIWHKHDGGPCPVDEATPTMMLCRGVYDRSLVVITAACPSFYEEEWRWMNDHVRVIAYTTDIFDGVFPKNVAILPDLMGGEHKVDKSDHIADVNKMVEPTRGAGCENEILP